MKQKRAIRRMLAVMLSVAMTVSMIPFAGGTVEAKASEQETEADKTIKGFTTKSIQNPTYKKGNWSYVYFGNYDGNHATRYRVLSNYTNNFRQKDKTDSYYTMFLDSEKILYTAPFDSSTNAWGSSSIRSALNGSSFLNKTGNFTVCEKNAIAESYQTQKLYVQDGLVQSPPFCDYTSLNKDKIFLLDMYEIYNGNYGFDIIGDNKDGLVVKTNEDGTVKIYWTRNKWDYSLVPADMDKVLCIDEKYQKSDLKTKLPNSSDIGVSPAFNIKCDSVFFTTLVSGRGYGGSEYKLTIFDPNMSVSVPSAVSLNGDRLTIPYSISGSNSSTATHLSVIFTDNKYNYSTTNLKHYYQYDLNTIPRSGNLTITLPEDYQGGWKMYLFAEDVNGEKETDYASQPVEITIPHGNHVFTYEAGTGKDANAVFATCSKPYCNLNNSRVKVQLYASSTTTYNGMIKTCPIVTEPSASNLPSELATVPDSSSVIYYVSEGYGSIVPVGDPLPDAPIDAGDYVAQFTWQGQTASKAFSVNKKSVTVSGISASDKTYDGSSDAAIDTSKAALSGLITGDDLTVSASGAFSDADARENKTVSLNVTLGGESAKNYSLSSGSQKTATADINPLEAALSWSNTEFTYDGSEKLPTAAVSNLVGEDVCTVTVTGAQTDANAPGESYTATAASLSNTNYKLPADPTTSFTIAGAASAGSLVARTNLVYSGYDQELVESPEGLLGGNITYRIGEAGEWTECSGSSFLPVGKDAGDYDIYYYVKADNSGNYKDLGSEEAPLGPVRATIAPKPVSIKGISAKDKVYDRSANATVSGNAVVEGVCTPDQNALGIRTGTASFADKNAGEGKAVSFSGFALTGTAAGNYALTGQPASVTADITPAPVKVSGITAENKRYDGSVSATLDVSKAVIDGLLEGDVLSVSANGIFDGADAGLDKKVYIRDLALGGKDAGNYVLAKEEQQEQTTADILQAKHENQNMRDSAMYGNAATADLSGSIVDGGKLSYVIADDPDSILASEPSVSDNTVTYALKDEESKVGKEATLFFAVISKNHKAYCIDLTVTVLDKNVQTVSFADVTDGKVTAVYGDAPFTKPASTTGDGTITYESSNGSVAAVTGSGLVTICGAGEAVITATAAETSGYKKASASYTLTVDPKPVTIEGVSAKDKVYDGTKTAEINGTAAIRGLVDADRSKVQVVPGTASFADQNAGTNVKVTFTGFSISGNSAGNYILTAQPSDSAADITLREVTLSWTNVIFTYDGESHIPSATAGNLVKGDTCAVSVTGAKTDAGSYEAEATGLSDANYKLPEKHVTSFEIKKASHPANTTAMARVKRGVAQENLTLQLPKAPEEGVYQGDSISYAGANPELITGATVSGNTLIYSTSAQGPGAKAMILIPVSGAKNYQLYIAAVTITTKGDAEVSVRSEDTKTYGDDAYDLMTYVARPGQNGIWAFSSSDETVATVSEDGMVTIRKAGKTNLTASYESDTTMGEDSLLLTVNKAVPKVPKVPTNNAILCCVDIQEYDLPAGFAFQEEDPVLVTGSNTLLLTYTPEDTENYVSVKDIAFPLYLSHGLQEDPVKAPTCEEAGHIACYTCKFCGKHFDAEHEGNEIPEEAYIDPAIGHEYEIFYDWGEDGKTCLGRAVCKNDASHVITMEGVVTGQQTKDPAIGKVGTTTYTAVFEGSEFFSEQTTERDDIPALQEQKDPGQGGEGGKDPAGQGGNGKDPGQGGSEKKAPAPEGTVLTAPEVKARVKVVAGEDNKPAVEMIALTDLSDDKIVVPPTVTIEGITYEVVRISDSAFAGNKNVKKITLGDNITAIGENAFKGCVNLTEIIIGKNVRSIGNNAFKGCKKLKKITVKTVKLTDKTVARKAFKGVGKKVKIKVPKKKKKVYQALFKKKGLSKKVKIS